MELEEAYRYDEDAARYPLVRGLLVQGCCAYYNAARETLLAQIARGQAAPTLIQAHGWGGVAANLLRDAIDIANAGYLVVAFDYRAWGESDARLILTKPSPIKPTSGQNQKFTAEVAEVREYVDPLEQVTGWFNVINWAAGESVVDKERIGLRGSSFSGGHVFYVAAREPRIKADVSQVASFDGRWVGSDKTQIELTLSEATKHALGEPYPAPRAVTVGRLIGALTFDRQFRDGDH